MFGYIYTKIVILYTRRFRRNKNSIKNASRWIKIFDVRYDRTTGRNRMCSCQELLFVLAYLCNSVKLTFQRRSQFYFFYSTTKTVVFVSTPFFRCFAERVRVFFPLISSLCSVYLRQKENCKCSVSIRCYTALYSPKPRISYATWINLCNAIKWCACSRNALEEY